MKLPSWREAQLERKGLRPDRPPRNAAWVITQLQGGAVLYSGREGDQRWWMLSDGRNINGNTARTVISDPRIIGGGDVLFEGVLAQTFRFVAEVE
jgi:hypothetical protein